MLSLWQCMPSSCFTFLLYDSDLPSNFPEPLAMEDDSDHILENDVLNQATSGNIPQKQNWTGIVYAEVPDRTENKGHKGVRTMCVGN